MRHESLTRDGPPYNSFRFSCTVCPAVYSRLSSVRARHYSLVTTVAGRVRPRSRFTRPAAPPFTRGALCTLPGAHNIDKTTPCDTRAHNTPHASVYQHHPWHSTCHSLRMRAGRARSTPRSGLRGTNTLPRGSPTYVAGSQAYIAALAPGRVRAQHSHSIGRTHRAKRTPRRRSP